MEIGTTNNISTPVAAKKYRDKELKIQDEVRVLILSVADFWLKARLLAAVDERKILTRLVKEQFSAGRISIASDDEGVGTPVELEMLVDLVKAYHVKETDVPGANDAKAEEIKDSIFFLVHPRHYRAAVCCFEGMWLMMEAVEENLAPVRVRKIQDKAKSILQKFNHAKEIGLGFDFAKEKRYLNFMSELIKQTGELAFSKFKIDYEEKNGLAGWEVAGWELINAIELDVQQFPEFENLVKDELIARLNKAGVETRDISQYVRRCNFPNESKMEKKYELIAKLESAKTQNEEL